MTEIRLKTITYESTNERGERERETLVEQPKIVNVFI